MSILFFIYGLIIGSFLNVCIYRIPRGESIVVTSSHCTCCSKKIKFYDLIPVVSYIILKGKCRYCKSNISIRYPIIEVITGLIYLSIFQVYGLSLISLKYIILMSFFIVISIIDYETQDIFFMTTYPCIIIGILFSIFGKYFFNDNLNSYLIGFLVSAAIIGFFVLITKGRGMAAGDIEIAAICGVFLGVESSLVTIALAFVIGTIYSVFLLVVKGKSRKEPVAFGPFLFMGSLIALFYGHEIAQLYLGYILMY